MNISFMRVKGLACDVLVDVEFDFWTFLFLADVAALQDVYLWV